MSNAATPSRKLRTWPQVLGVLILAPIGAELLTAYGESTGDPGAVAFSLVFFAALYGAPALLARELVAGKAGVGRRYSSCWLPSASVRHV